MDSSLPSGLTNVGSTWFANASITIILHIFLLQEYINIKKVLRIATVNMIII